MFGEVNRFVFENHFEYGMIFLNYQLNFNLKSVLLINTLNEKRI
ncbi:hypothetical protein SAMD00020551_2837 [Mesobacillus selenatarsenatis SF-1]|uniref:Uncharacterized protein n=1 Tax=Mesobacillus selenatarsenatis (strain DSM 18680 / JCM 14380 / FERM P-15431 / SF-1) TaxID=1321606 RepID=A0A0A8X5X5_MESS1|nr:hypothetical protein SAMD00020551_2837 [Mesobacillus selenatarsenatis SF-1]